MSHPMAIAVRESISERMEIARDGLASMTRASDPEIESLTRQFEALAGQSSRILGLASSIAEYIEGDSVKSVLPAVQALGSAGITFVESRLEASHGILETAAAEMTLLRRLSKVASSQSRIALRTRVLAMMINIEMGRLGSSGLAFESLASELANFSRTLSENTDELERRTDARGTAIQATSRVLTLEVPRLAGELVHVRIELGNELRLLESGLAELGSIPAQFKAGVEEIAAQIAAAIAAIQSYDITRQQIEHVQEAIADIAVQIGGEGKHRSRDSQKRARTSLGVNIQIYQLRQIRQTVDCWMSRIRVCLEVMLKVSASNLAGINPIVKERERDISARLAHIDLLQSESKTQSEVICRTVGEHSTLSRLIDDQVKNAAVTRQTLHLLSLNTIVEADRLGARANAILEIGSGISDLSLEWSRIADQSGQALQETSELVERIDVLMATFSETEGQQLHHARMHARAALQRLHAASEFAARQACDIELGLKTMKVMAGAITISVDLLDASYRQLDEIRNHLQDVQVQLEPDASDMHCAYDREEMMEHFSDSYTTEVEREVLQAALSGTALAPVRQSLEGNGVELF
jgi:hypothetical protein